MLLRRLATAALLLATSAGLPSHALETAETSRKHPAPKTTANGEIKRAPVAKPFKTKSTKGRKSKSSAKTTAKSSSTKSASTKTASTTVPTQAATYGTATLR